MLLRRSSSFRLGQCENGSRVAIEFEGNATDSRLPILEMIDTSAMFFPQTEILVTPPMSVALDLERTISDVKAVIN